LFELIIWVEKYIICNNNKVEREIMETLNVLIKPSSSLCNLSCRYCFYHSLAEKNREKFSFGFMSEQTLENLVSRAFAETKRIVSFAFQGGEPTLCGLGFYEKLIGLVKKYNTEKISVAYAIQTNGILIDEKWARFLHDNNFLVGISLDGPKEIHDPNRVYSNGKGSFNDVMKAIEIMKKYDVQFNILTVVTSGVARHIEKIYRFFKSQGFSYLQFIPCLEPLGEVSEKNKYSLSPERYRDFLIKLFDLYYRDFIDNSYTSIRYFDNLVGMLLGNRPESCDMNGICSVQFVVEGDGGVYPCDFYCTDEWRLVNINDSSYEELAATDTAQKFIDISKFHSPECTSCKYYPLCRGGCRRTREPIIEGVPQEQFFCYSFREFFKTALPALEDMARRVSAANKRNGL
jgi:uncharacterized protein